MYGEINRYVCVGEELYCVCKHIFVWIYYGKGLFIVILQLQGCKMNLSSFFFYAT